MHVGARIDLHGLAFLDEQRVAGQELRFEE
jgi:hypothetical protein